MPLPQPEEVLELAAQLREARSRVLYLEGRWKDFFTLANEEESPSVTTTHLKPRIVQFLEERPEMAFSASSVSSALAASENSVGPYLSILAKEGRIERRDRGLYGALRPEETASEAAENGITDRDIPW